MAEYNESVVETVIKNTTHILELNDEELELINNLLMNFNEPDRKLFINYGDGPKKLSDKYLIILRGIYNAIGHKSQVSKGIWRDA